MGKFYSKQAEDVYKELETSQEGLKDDEVVLRREKYGANSLNEAKKKNVFIVFLEQFKDLLVIILILAAALSMVTGSIESAIVIIAVIILNAVLGTVQHVKAEKSLESLKALSAPSAKVIRNGQVTSVPSNEVVPGDIIMLEAGDLVVADGRIINNYSLQVNESSLTGESTAVDKVADVLTDTELALADQVNMVFSGSLVTYGRAMMVVTGTGMNTEIGKIASLMNATKARRTPLQVSLDKFSKTLAIIIMAICALVFGLTLWRGWNPADIKASIIDSLIFAVALAVAAIPEALSSIVTIVQAVGTQKMAKQNAIIKDLKAVESLGAVSIICSDKTGTLTQNKMTVQTLYTGGEQFNADAVDLSNPAHKAMLYAMVLANDSTSINGEEIGDPTEVALINLAHTYGIDEVALRKEHKRLDEIAFDSDRKLMSTMHNFGDGEVMLTKGAFDVLLKRSNKILTKDGIREITTQDVERINQVNLEMSSNGLRVLSFAVKECKGTQDIDVADEQEFIFVGLVSMIDPPREESKQAVKDARMAGIKPIMITGDHKITASAIARQIGIFTDGDEALEGVELDAMSDEELDKRLDRIAVYARVSPEHKIRIVDAWQRKGNIVAMTGDGVNDAPALKQAEIGVAMGITGTEVSKDAADMILTDDNFATIVKSVANGRNIYNNIKNAIAFLLSGNIAGIFCILITSIAGWPIPFHAVHLLFINLLTDSLPAIAIGMEPAGSDLLRDKPRNPKESILNRNLLIKIALQGALICIFTMSAYWLGFDDPDTAATMAFATITLARLFHGFNCRGNASIFKLGLRSNMYSVYAFIAGVVLLVSVIFIPGINSLFDIAKLSGAQIGFIVLFAVSPTIIIQAVKSVRDIIMYTKDKKDAAV